MGRTFLALLVIASGCRHHFETAGDASGDANGEADTSPDAAAAANCTPAMFVADFQTVPSWASTYSDGAATLNVASGQLRVDLGMIATSSSAGIHSSAFTLSQMRISVRVDAVLDVAPAARAYMCLSDCNNGAIDAVVLQGGMIRVEVASQPIAIRIYDPTGDRFWRARQNAMTTYVETSADGSSWNRLVTYPTPAVPAQLWLGAWNNGDPNGGSISFSQFQSCIEP